MSYFIFSSINLCQVDCPSHSQTCRVAEHTRDCLVNDNEVLWIKHIIPNFKNTQLHSIRTQTTNLVINCEFQYFGLWPLELFQKLIIAIIKCQRARQKPRTTENFELCKYWELALSFYYLKKNKLKYLSVYFHAWKPFEIGRAHVWTPVTPISRMPSSAWKKKLIKQHYL